MPYNPSSFTGTASLPTLGAPGIAAIPEQLAKGFELSQMPAKIRAQMVADQLAKLQLQQEPEKFKSEQALRGAQMQKALSPDKPVQSNFEKAMNGANRISEHYGADSPEAKMANNYVKRLSEGSQGMQLTVDPKTGALSFSQGGSGRNSQAQEVIDGQLVSKPTMATSSANQKSAVANKAFTDIEQDFNQPYKGFAPSIAIGKDLVDYKIMEDGEEKNKLAQKLVDANVANRFLPEMTSLQLLSQGTPSTIPAIEHQSRALSSGWPQKMQTIMNAYPKELQDMAEKQHAKLMQKSAKLKQTYVAQGMPLDLQQKYGEKDKAEDMTHLSNDELKKIISGGK